MKKLCLIAGHTQGEGEGARNLKTNETENMITRALLPGIYKTIKKEILTDLCPFDYLLWKKIYFVNNQQSHPDITIEFHLDSSTKRTEKGAMCYYYGGSPTSQKKAKEILDIYCLTTGIQNNGVRPDTASRFGRLGIIRDTMGWAFLFELGSINNDLEAVKNNATKGILAMLRFLFKKEKKDYPPHTIWAKDLGIIDNFDELKNKITLDQFLSYLKKYHQNKNAR